MQVKSSILNERRNTLLNKKMLRNPRMKMDRNLHSLRDDDKICYQYVKLK